MDYRVKKGDSLYKISEKFYGEGFFWDTIYTKNKDVIGSNPDLIYEGQVIMIPEHVSLINKLLNC